MNTDPPAEPPDAASTEPAPLWSGVTSAVRVGTWEWNIPTGEVVWSEGMEALLGTTPGSLGGTSAAFINRVYPDDRAAVTQAVSRVLEGEGSSYFLEHRVVSAAGEIRWVEGHGQVFRDEGGKPRLMTGTLTDITERKLAEAETEFIYETLSAVSRSASLDDALQEVLRRTCETIGWEGGQVWLPSPTGLWLECGNASHLPHPDYQRIAEDSVGRRFAPGEGLPGRAWQSRQLAWIRMGSQITELPRQALAEELGIRVSLAVPVQDGEEVLAVLQFGTRHVDQADARVLGLLTTLAERLGPAIQRRRTEDALRQSERRHRETLERVRLIAVGLNLQGEVVFCNDALCRITGYARAEMIGENWFHRFVPAESRAGLETLLEVAVQLGEIAPQSEAEILTRSGERRTIAWNCAVLHDPAGVVVGVSALGDDVTEARRAQEQNRRLLAELRERVKELTALHTAAGWLRNEGLSLQDQVERLATLLPPAFQYPEITVGRIRAGSIVASTPGFAERGAKLVVEFDAGNDSGYLEVRYLEERPPAAEGPFLTEERKLLTSLAEMLRTTCMNRRAQEALTQSVERYHSLIAASAQAIWTTDQHGVVVADIPSWRAFTGQSKEELLAPGGWMQAVHPEDRDRVARAWEEAVQSRSVYEVEYRIRVADGSYHHVLARGVPVPDEEGNVREWVGAATDITERVRLQSQFLQSQKMEALGRLAGGVAHDFNNMLSVINGYTELSLMQTPPEDPRHDHLLQVRRAGERAHAMTRQLLLFSRREEGHPQAVQLNDLARDMQRMLQRLIGQDIRISLILAEELGAIRAEPGLIEQVIMNLAVNARDAMPQGGQLIIETTQLEAPELTEAPPGSVPQSDLGQGHVQLSITDTGTGIPPEVLPHIFEPFFTTKPPELGTGLGLATVYRIVEQCGGTIEVLTEPNWGTSFQLRFPLHPNATQEGDAIPEEKPPSGGVETVLLVEDEAMVRRLVRSVLQAEGYTVLEASSGSEALEALRQHSGPVDLLLTDVVIPDMSGREVAEAVRAHLPEIPVIYMTGYSNDAYFRQDLAERTEVLLEKPFPPSALTRLLRQLLDREKP